LRQTLSLRVIAPYFMYSACFHKTCCHTEGRIAVNGIAAMY